MTALIKWKKHPANPILTEALHGDVKVHEWRDPFLFRERGRTYMVLGGNLNASKGGEAVVTVYRAEDDGLTRWTYLGVLFRHPDAAVKNIECPNFFRLGEKWVLIVSQGMPVQYFVGSLDPEAMRFRAEHGASWITAMSTRPTAWKTPRADASSGAGSTDTRAVAAGSTA